jgi:hypothetical protein
MTTKKTAAKTAKPAAKTTKPTATTEPTAKLSKPATETAKVKTPPTHEEIAQLAKQYWIEGGYREGHAEQDWIRAEQELGGK